MKTTIWVMNHYAGGMLFDHGGRHYNFVKYLKESEYDPIVFCANSKHNAAGCWFESSALWHEHMAEEIGVPFVFVNARAYTGNGKQRVLNMADFYRNVKKAAKAYAKVHGTPDIIYASSVHPLTLVAGIQLAKYFGIECICEMRDLWPEGIVVAYPNRLSRQQPLIRLLYQGEKWIYKKADKLIFTMEGGAQYIADRGWDTAHGGPIDLKKVFHINNGVDLATFNYNRDNFPVEDADLDNPDIFKVVYTGSIRRVNNLSLLVDAAKAVTDPRIKFLIWGEGDELPALRQRLVDERIENVVFKGRVDKKYIPSIVSRADLNIAHNMSSPLFCYGISFNKIFDYLAAGKPIFSDFPCKYNPTVQYGAGTDLEQPSAQAIARSIQDFCALSPAEYTVYQKNAVRAAEEYDFANLTKKLIAVIEDCVG